jgi:hypothetical protein
MAATVVKTTPQKVLLAKILLALWVDKADSFLEVGVCIDLN